MPLGKQKQKERRKERKKGTSCHLIESDLLGSFKTKNAIAQQKILSLGSRWTKIQSARRENLCLKTSQLFQQLNNSSKNIVANWLALHRH